MTDEIKTQTVPEEMTVAKGLRELKLLDKRISKGASPELETTLFVSAVRGQDKVTVHKQMPLDEAEKLFKTNLQSLRDLISRRSKIKTAIVNSNAVTFVSIGGKKMSVAGAIERKTSINYDKQLLTAMKRNLSNVEGWMDSKNNEVERQLQKILESNSGSDSEKLKEGIGKVIEAHRDANEVKLYDPLKIRDIIREMDEEIDSFEAEVDLALTESNAITLIKLG